MAFKDKTAPILLDENEYYHARTRYLDTHEWSEDSVDEENDKKLVEREKKRKSAMDQQAKENRKKEREQKNLEKQQKRQNKEVQREEVKKQKEETKLLKKKLQKEEKKQKEERQKINAENRAAFNKDKNKNKNKKNTDAGPGAGAAEAPEDSGYDAEAMDESGDESVDNSNVPVPVATTTTTSQRRQQSGGSSNIAPVKTTTRSGRHASIGLNTMCECGCETQFPRKEMVRCKGNDPAYKTGCEK